MSTHEPTTAQTRLMERLGGIVPTTYRQEMVRVARRLRDRLPPVVIARRIDALERHIDRRFKEMAAKLDELSRRVGSGAA